MKTALIIAFIAATQAAFTIPPGQADGVYNHFIDKNGTHVHQWLANLDDARKGLMTKSRIESRQASTLTGGITCAQDGAILTANDILNAGSALAGSCGKGKDYGFIPAWGDRYSKSGDAVVYTCNYSYGNSQHCTANEVNNNIDAITKKCNGGVAGWWYHEDWWKSYGYDDSTKTFCF